MAVTAGLVAELADIDLEDRNSRGMERFQACLIQLRFEREASTGLCQQLELLGRGGEGIMSSQQGQRHIRSRPKMNKSARKRSSSARMTDRQQGRLWKSQLTAAEIQGLSLSVCQSSLNRGRYFITNLFALSMSFDQA